MTVCGEFDNVSRFSYWQPAERVDAIVRRILNQKEQGENFRVKNSSAN